MNPAPFTRDSEDSSMHTEEIDIKSMKKMNLPETTGNEKKPPDGDEEDKRRSDVKGNAVHCIKTDDGSSASNKKPSSSENGIAKGTNEKEKGREKENGEKEKGRSIFSSDTHFSCSLLLSW